MYVIWSDLNQHNVTKEKMHILRNCKTEYTQLNSVRYIIKENNQATELHRVVN